MLSKNSVALLRKLVFSGRNVKKVEKLAVGRTIFILSHSLYGQRSACSYMSQSVGLFQCLEGKVDDRNVKERQCAQDHKVSSKYRQFKHSYMGLSNTVLLFKDKHLSSLT